MPKTTSPLTISLEIRNASKQLDKISDRYAEDEDDRDIAQSFRAACESIATVLLPGPLTARFYAALFAREALCAISANAALYQSLCDEDAADLKALRQLERLANDKLADELNALSKNA